MTTRPPALPHRQRGKALDRVMAEHPRPASLAVLWDQAQGDPERFRELMRGHGLILSPGDPGYEGTPSSLPCGWAGGGSGKDSTEGGGGAR